MSDETGTCESPLCDSTLTRRVTRLIDNVEMVVCYDHYVDIFHHDWAWEKDIPYLRERFENRNDFPD